MLIEMGVAGLLLAAAGLFLIVRSVVRLPRLRRGPPLAAITAVLTANMFLSNFNFKYFWFVLTYGVVVVGMENVDPQRSVTTRRVVEAARVSVSSAPSRTTGSS
jgi:hypothetical protein